MKVLRTNLMVAAAMTPLCSAVFVGGADAAHFRTLYSFCAEVNCTDGLIPTGSLFRDPDGDLYGVTGEAGQNGSHGTAYRLLHKGKTWRLQTLHTFCSEQNCADGDVPTGGLIEDVNGNLYGTTVFGGSHGGVVFELLPNARRTAYTLQVLANFCSAQNCADGVGPDGGLSYAGRDTGALYNGTSPLFGTTSAGGSTDSGTVFELTPSGQGAWNYSVIHSFCLQPNCTDGLSPRTRVTFDGAGNMFSTASGGGTGNHGRISAGMVFELSPQGGWTYTPRYNFCSVPHCRDGQFPVAPVTLDAQGEILGTTILGTNKHTGTIFRLTPDGDGVDEQVLHAFCKGSDCPDGAEPTAGVLIDGTGTVFGAAPAGGKNLEGVFFRYDGSYRVIHEFCAEANCTDGGQPLGTPVTDGSGRIYGIAQIGGANNHGMIFELTP